MSGSTARPVLLNESAIIAHVASHRHRLDLLAGYDEPTLFEECQNPVQVGRFVDFS